MAPTVIKPYEEINPKIYAFTLPQVPTHDGYVKIGGTTRQVETRVLEIIGTAGLNAEILFQRLAKKSDGTWFSDRELHRFLLLNGIHKAELNRQADEWFFFNDHLEKAEILTDKFINNDYDTIFVDDENFDYVLRQEQRRAVADTLDYYNSGKEPREFLWNAKPRFGKTLTAYDFIRQIQASNTLIVTNRPAIAISWFEDFKRFIAWQEPHLRFVSETEALKNKALTREEYLAQLTPENQDQISQITFISLQDLKGAKFVGGEFDKLEWVGSLNWDLLIIDEAHEGVDTKKTDVAFDKINRDFTLHLSGTPFKALASNKFREAQIFNWSYMDEQTAKSNWDYTMGTNPYERLPKLNLFAYQMSRMIEERVSKGLTLDDETNVDFAFDLNEFFKVKDNGKFEHEASVKKFLDNLSSGGFPFSPEQYKAELNHTFWLLPRVNSAKALEVLLREHPVFSKYHIVLAAGDGISIHAEATDMKTNEQSLHRVRNAIKNGEKTITLSVGQLTTGVTIPEWSAVLMLSNIKSPSVYFQAAFRAQNPYEFSRDGKLYRKENAYIFDFAPERTLVLFDEFANNLSGDISRDIIERKKKIKNLLNFFPVIGEDEDGIMHELDATEVLTIPARIISREVVKRGFMSNLLFANIAGIFSGNAILKEILEKLRPERNRRLDEPSEINITDPMLDVEGDVYIPNEIIINQTKDLFGEAIYKVIEIPSDTELNTNVIADEVEELVETGFNNFKDHFQLTQIVTNRIKAEAKDKVKEVIEQNINTYADGIEELSNKFANEIKAAREERNDFKIERLEKDFEQEKVKATETFISQVNEEVSKILETKVEKQLEQKEEAKKKTTEDDVRARLRGFARTIPAFLMAYGNENTTISNFDEHVDKDTFEELTSITLDEFIMLRDGFDYIDDDGNNRRQSGVFNETVFNASIKEFFATKQKLGNYFDDALEEDIFDYIPPQKTNQIFTPRKVAKMMVDTLEENNPSIFSDYTAKFLDPYAKSGMYITEIAKRLFKGLKERIPNRKERLKWILENQIYAIAPSNITYNIVKSYVFSDFEDISTKNIAELDLVEYVNDGATMNWQQIIKKAFGGEDLKFDVIIGNPPYQEMDGGAQASASPLYHKFVELAKKLNPELISFIIPTRWYIGGKGLNDFRREMLSDARLKELHDWLTPEDIFPNTNIRGGVCYFLWDNKYNNEKKFTRVVTYENNKLVSEIVRPMSIGGTGIFIRDAKAFPILTKVFRDDRAEILLDHISPRKPFGLEGFFVNDKRFRNSKLGLTNPIICYARGKVMGYLDKREVPLRKEWIGLWKVFTPRANNIGTELNDDNLNTFVGKPGTICTESYLVIGANLNLSEMGALNLSKYLTTKFARYLHSLAKASHDATAKTYRFVPLQDFSEKSDIDWSKTVKELDKQLYKKYGLTPEEIKHIEIKIKDMENVDGI